MKQEKIKPWEQQDISNSVMFRLVMESKDLCKTALERILDIKITKLVVLEPEKSLEYKVSSKGIRLDIYAEDDKGVCYDLEMQSYDDESYLLGKRTRYYQSLMDGDLIKKGEPYDCLKKSYVIFICKFDPFNKQYGRYTFNNWCDENKSISLGDEATKILLNTKGDKQGMSKELAVFLDYIESGKPADAYTEELDNVVKVLKRDKGARDMYWTWEQLKAEHFNKGKNAGKREGLVEGLKIGQLQTLCKLVLEGDLSMEKAAAKTDMSVEKFKTILEEYKNTGDIAI